MNENYCAAVDTGLFIYPSGQVGYCCSGTEHLGNVNNESLQDIYKKSRFIEIRNNLKNNKSDSYCDGCHKLEQTAPGTSQKSAFNDQFGTKVERQLRLIDIRWSNVCNLSCRYCNVNDSSEWRKLANLPVSNVNKDYIESVLTEIKNNRETIENVYLLGGEPLLQKYNEQLLDIVNPESKIDILTNLSIKLDNNLIYEKLKRMKNVLWNLSFDNIGDRFEYVRQGADWNIFQDNLKRIQDDFGKHRITFHPVYTIWNSLNLVEFYEFSRTNSARVNWQLAHPKNDIKDLSTDAFIVFGHKSSIIHRAIEEINRCNLNDPTLMGIKNSLIHSQEIAGQDRKFLDWTDKMEKFMPPKKTFSALWPELYRLLNA
jgi:radical SAM protein with 4Fe4S-binding SPASM domain